MAVWQWSRTSTSNNTADPSMNWSEGIPPSIVNDNVRALMTRIAEWRDDTSGNNATTGTPPNWSLTTAQGLPATPPNGQLIAFFPNVTNAGGDTLTIDGGNTYPIQSPAGSPIGAGVLVAGTAYTFVFASSPFSCWVPRDSYGTPFVVPIGAMIDWTGGASPNANFALPCGQAISRTTYSVLNGIYAALGYPYGNGDGFSTFNLIDMRGRVGAGLDNMGGFTGPGQIGIIGTDTGTINGAVLGSHGGSSFHVQTQAEMPAVAPSGSITMGGSATINGLVTASGGQGMGSGSPPFNNTNDSRTINGSSFTASFSGNAIGGGATMAWLQPTIMVNKLLRIS